MFFLIENKMCSICTVVCQVSMNYNSSFEFTFPFSHVKIFYDDSGIKSLNFITKIKCNVFEDDNLTGFTGYRQN